MGDFKELQVWRLAHALSLDIYKLTASFPRCEVYGLSQQLRRAAVSVEANLAEGCGRKTDRELARFALISNGSAYELESELLVARDLGYITREQHEACDQQIKRVSSMLNGLAKHLQTQQRRREIAPATRDL